MSSFFVSWRGQGRKLLLTTTVGGATYSPSMQHPAVLLRVPLIPSGGMQEEQILIPYVLSIPSDDWI